VNDAKRVHAATASKRRVVILIAIGAGIVVIVAALGLMFVLRDFVRQAIVLPLSYIAWLAGLVLNSLPQATYWALLLAAAILVAWKSLGAPRRLFYQRKVTPIIADSRVMSLLAARQAQLAQLNLSVFARERTAFELRALVVKLLAYQERQSSSEIEQRIRAGTLETPPEIHALLTDWQSWLADEPANPWERRLGRWRWLRQLRWRMSPGRQQISNQPQPSPFERKLARAIEYMETQLGSHAPADQPAGQLPEE
jgi:hypothetical protein